MPKSASIGFRPLLARDKNNVPLESETTHINWLPPEVLVLENLEVVKKHEEFHQHNINLCFKIPNRSSIEPLSVHPIPG